MPSTEGSKQALSHKPDHALDMLWKSCYEWHRQRHTAGVKDVGPIKSISAVQVRDTIGSRRLFDYVVAGWRKARSLDLAPEQRSTVREKQVKDTKDMGADSWEAWRNVSHGAWKIHVDEVAESGFLELKEELALNVFQRLLCHVFGLLQGAELYMEEGDYARVYVTQCPGDVQIFWGPALLRLPEDDKVDKKFLAPGSSGQGSRISVCEVLRVYSIASSHKSNESRRSVAAFFARSPCAQLPWHVFGPPLALETNTPKKHCNDGVVMLTSTGEIELNLPVFADDPKEVRCRARPRIQRRVAHLDDMRSFLEIVGGDRLTEEEKLAGSACGNSLVVGRSGTGKTTVAMLRMAAFEMLRSPGEGSPQAVFLTASPVLSREVLRSFTSLKNFPGLRKLLLESGLIKTRAACGQVDSIAEHDSHDSVDSVEGQMAKSSGVEDQMANSSQVGSHNEVVKVSAGVASSPCDDGNFSGVHSLGSWLALEPSPTEESFEMVEAEVFDLATLATEESVEVDDNSLIESCQNDVDIAFDTDASGDVPLSALDSLPDNEDTDETAEGNTWAPLPGPRLPPALSIANSDDFPMFLTVRHLLHMLDAGLQQPFFARGDDFRPVDVDVCTWQPEGGGVRLVNEWAGGAKWQPSVVSDASDELDDGSANDLLHSMRSGVEVHKALPGGRQPAKKKGAPTKSRIEVGYEYFADVLWPNIPCSRDLQAEGFHPSLVWTEIIANIKGSKEAFASNGAITAEQYLGEFGRKRTPMTEEQRRKVYSIYKEYERLKAELGAFDEADFVWHLHKHIRAEGYAGVRIRCLVIDEVQDISQAALRLILELVEPQSGGLFLCGDPAQTISKGLAFRLCDLQSAFVEGTCTSNHARPEVTRLTTNFRSTMPVLRLANDVLSMLSAYFPNALDHGGKETAAGKGDGPQPSRAASLQDLLVEITSSQPSSAAAFGADLVVLVREQSQKLNLPSLLQHCLVMTVWEAKGLEFDTVVILDFFKSAQADWSVLEHNGSTPPEDFKIESHALLCCELKQLYVAITRAKRRLIFFDDSPSIGCRQLWSTDEVDELEPKAELLNELSDKAVDEASCAAWRSQGRRLLRLGYSAQAELCFTRSGDEELKSEAQATTLAKDAATELARLQVRGTVKLAVREEKQESVESEGATIENIMSQFRRAAELFDSCSKPAHAAKCLAAMGEWLSAADRFRAAGHWDEAAVSLMQAGLPRDAAECFEQGGQWLRALEAWEQAGEFTALIQAARKTLERSSCNREEVLVFVRRALESLPDPVAIREAARLLGAPCSCEPDDHVIGIFLADALGAEAAALRLMGSGNWSDEVALRLRAFHRSVLLSKPAWQLLVNFDDRLCALAAVLYGLAPPKQIIVDITSAAQGLHLADHFTCALLPKGHTLSLQQSLVVNEGHEAAPLDQVLMARKAVEAEHKVKQVTHSTQDSFQKLKQATAIPYAPSHVVRSLALRYARDVWTARGPLGPVSCTTPSVAAALLAAADSTWGHSQQRDGCLEQTFALLSAIGENAPELFLELRGIGPHAALAAYLVAIRNGALSDAANALICYMESSVSERTSGNFLSMLVSYIVGPATQVLQPASGAYVMSCLVWDWPSELQGVWLSDLMMRLRELLNEKSEAVSDVKSNSKKQKREKRRRGPDLVDDDWRDALDDHTERNAPNAKGGRQTSGWATEAAYVGNVTLQEATLAQLAYCLGDEIEDEWWNEEWSDVFEAALPVADKTAQAWQGELHQRCERRRAAGVKIATWGLRAWKGHQQQSVWPVLCSTAQALRCLRSVPPSSASSLVLAASRFLHGNGTALDVRLCARRLESKEQEVQRRQEGLRVRREAERTKSAREQRQAEQRFRGQKKQEALERKALRLKSWKMDRRS